MRCLPRSLETTIPSVTAANRPRRAFSSRSRSIADVFDDARKADGERRRKRKWLGRPVGMGAFIRGGGGAGGQVRLDGNRHS